MMNTTKNTLQANISQLIEQVAQWNADNEQKNGDLAEVKVNATEEYLKQSVTLQWSFFH